MRFCLGFLAALFGTAQITNEVYGKPGSSSGGGSKQTTSKPRNGQEPSPDTRNAPDLCQSPEIDAVTKTPDGKTYVFKGEYYWRILTDGIADGYPQVIKNDWDGLPSNLDAALTWSDGKTFFFKGSQYWRFNNKKMESGYPKEIKLGFKGIPNNIDAALLWGGNGKTYFFKGSEYWRFDSRLEPPVSDKYPKPISNWVGLPNDLNAAFQWENEKTYFFKGRKYYRFNDNDFAVDKGDPGYPRSTSTWWFNCKVMHGQDSVHRSGVMKSEIKVRISGSGESGTTESDQSVSDTSDDTESSESWEDSSTKATTTTNLATTHGSTKDNGHSNNMQSGRGNYDVGILEEYSTTEHNVDTSIDVNVSEPTSTPLTLTSNGQLIWPGKSVLMTVLITMYFQKY